MANGQLPGSVAPTSIGQGKSYSEMMNEQIALIQQQRSANLDKRLAQEEKNRQFRTEQLQNIYDFDVSGLASGDVRVLADMQRQLAVSLDPNSESSYSDSQQLVADIALINNAYNEMKRWADSGGQGRQLYQNGLLQPERGDGTVVVADEDMLNSRNEVWEKGAFAEGSVKLVGPPGNRQLVGMALDVDGNEVGEVNFFENSMRNQPDQFWRQEVMPAAPYAATLTERALTDERLDGKNTREIAEIDFAVMNQQAKDRFRKEQYEKVKPADGKAFEELTEEDYKRLKIDDESLINEMVADYDKGLEARPGTAGADAFDFNRSIANMPQLSKPVKLRSEDEELAGTIEGAQFQQGLDLDTLQKAPNGAPLIPVEVAYVQSNGTIVKKVLDPATNPVEYDAFMEAIGRRGKEQLLQYSGYYQTPGGPQVDVGEDPQASSPRDIGVDETAEVRENLEDIEDLTITGSADGSPGAKLESDRQMLLDDIKDAEDELKLQMSLSGGNAGNLTGRMEAMERLVELQEQLAPINDALEELGIERIEYEPVGVPAADAGGAGAGGADPDASTAQADPVATERDLSGLPTISPIARSASDSIAMSEGYSPDLQINVPDTINSGVTIAGLDIGGLNPEGDSVKMDILERYLSPEDFSALNQLVGLKGSEAQKKLEELQGQGLLQQDGLGLTEQDIIDIPALYVSAVELPRIYKIIPEEEFASLPPDVRNVVLDVQFNVHGPNTLKKIREAIASGDKASWMEVANAYYNPETEATYFGSKEQTQQKIDNGNIGRGNVKRVKAARENLLAWIEKTYG